MAPSWGTSCLRSNRRILSTVSISGERPPWTQRMEPVEDGGWMGKDEEDCCEVLGCGVLPRVGDEALGREEDGGRSAAGERASRSGAGEMWPLLVLFGGGSRSGGVRMVFAWTRPWESRTSLSMSSSSAGRVDWVDSSRLIEGVGARSVVAPRIRAPRAR